MALLLVACSQPRSEPPAPASPATLRPIVLPDLSRMEKPVQEQMREAYATLTKKIDAGGTPPADLAAAYGEMGNLLMAAEYLDAAEPCYLNAQTLAPGERRWPYYLGHVHRTKGEPAKAAQAFGRALEIAPADVATLVWLGQVSLDRGQPDTADRLYARAIAVQPQSVAALAGQGRAALATRDYARAAGRFGQALSIDPRASTLHYPLALAYRGLGDMEKADAQARQRGDIEVGPADPLMQEIAIVLNSAASYERRGLRALEGRDWASAAAAFRKAVELAPESASAHHRLGTVLSVSGDTRGAVDQFQESIRRSPGYAPAHFSLGVLRASSGQLADAADEFSAAVRSEPGNADARLQLAVALLRLKRYQEAHAQLLEGARLHPQRAEFNRLLAQLRPAR